MNLSTRKGSPPVTYPSVCSSSVPSFSLAVTVSPESPYSVRNRNPTLLPGGISSRPSSCDQTLIRRSLICCCDAFRTRTRLETASITKGDSRSPITAITSSMSDLLRFIVPCNTAKFRRTAPSPSPNQKTIYRKNRAGRASVHGFVRRFSYGSE